MPQLERHAPEKRSLPPIRGFLALLAVGALTACSAPPGPPVGSAAPEKMRTPLGQRGTGATTLPNPSFVALRQDRARTYPIAEPGQPPAAPAPGLILQSETGLPLADGPLLALGAYIELSGNCDGDLVEWNRTNLGKARRGEITRSAYYRLLGYLAWGPCGRPYFATILDELQKAADIHAEGLVSAPEFERKEAELVNLFFAALQDEKNGDALVRTYERTMAARLTGLAQPRQYFDCTFFGDEPQCRE